MTTGKGHLAHASKLIRDARRVILVCAGNICRSPYAERYLRIAAAERGIPLCPVISRGIMHTDGVESSGTAREAAEQTRVALDDHISRSIYREKLAPDDVFLLVEPRHLEPLLDLDSTIEQRTVFLGLLDPELPQAVIEDPYGGDLDHYLTAYARIRRAVDSLLGALAGEAV